MPTAHPMTSQKAAELGARRCYYSGVPAIAYPGRSGYVNVHLLKDPGYGSLYQPGTAPGNCRFLDD